MKRPTFIATFAFLFPILFFCIIALHSDDTESPSKADDTEEPAATSTEIQAQLGRRRQMLEDRRASLRSDRQQIMEAFVDGEKEPIVKAIDGQIDAITRMIDVLPPLMDTVPSVPDPLEGLRGDVQSMNDQQLRATVELLIDRLLKLENRVRRMNEPRVQLLH